jgi:hypothetical protein
LDQALAHAFIPLLYKLTIFDFTVFPLCPLRLFESHQRHRGFIRAVPLESGARDLRSCLKLPFIRIPAPLVSREWKP